MGVAVMARVIMKHSRKLAHMVAEEAFIAGLIHDVGKLVLYQSFTREFTDAMNLCRTEQLTLVLAEERVFGFTHQDIGAWVADEWGFSRNMVKAIELHNSPYIMDDEDESFVFVSLVHIADLLSHFLAFGNSGDPFLPVFHFDCYDALGIDLKEIEEMLEEGRKAFAEIAGALT